MRRSLILAAAILALGRGHLRAGRRSQGRADLWQDRSARSLCQADRDRPAMGFEYATKGTMTLDGRKIVVITKDDQGKPDLSKAALAEAYQDDKADIAIGTTSSAAALADPPGRRGEQEDPDRRARGRGPDYRREVESLHLPHRAQFLAGRDLERGGDRQAGRHRRDAGAGLRLRPRRRRRLQGGAGQDRRDARRRRICPDHHHRLHRGRPAPVRCAEGQAGPQDHLGDLGRRRQSAGKAAGHGPEALRHRAVDRRQHPAGARGLQAACPAWKARPITTTTSRRTR